MVSNTLLNELKNGLAAWEQELIRPLWLESDQWNAVTYEIHQALMENREPKYISPGEMMSFRSNDTRN